MRALIQTTLNGLLAMIIVATLVVMGGCGEGMNMAKPVVPAPDTEPPRILEINHYMDSQLSTLIEGPVYPRVTIYTKVVFSEPMQHVVANDGTGRPVLFYILNDGKETRYRIVSSGASGGDFTSGTAKPLSEGAKVYICKYTVQDTDTGSFSIKVGAGSVDIAGNQVREQQSASLVVKPVPDPDPAPDPDPKPDPEPAPDPAPEPEPDPIIPAPDTESPMVLEMGHYYELQLFTRMIGPIYEGVTVYTKVVFSEPMQHVVANDETARPVLFYILNNGEEARYRIVSSGASGEDFTSGTAKPLSEGAKAYICKYTVQDTDTGTFSIKVGAGSVDIAGNQVKEQHSASLVIIPLPDPDPDPKPDPEEILKKINETFKVFYDDVVPTSKTLEDLKRGFLATFGFTFDFVEITLRNILYEEIPEEEEDFPPGRIQLGVITAEWLRLLLIYPEKEEKALLDLFRERCREGWVTVSSAVNVAHGYKPKKYH